MSEVFEAYAGELALDSDRVGVMYIARGMMFCTLRRQELQPPEIWTFNGTEWVLDFRGPERDASAQELPIYNFTSMLEYRGVLYAGCETGFGALRIYRRHAALDWQVAFELDEPEEGAFWRGAVTGLHTYQGKMFGVFDKGYILCYDGVEDKWTVDYSTFITEATQWLDSIFFWPTSLESYRERLFLGCGVHNKEMAVYEYDGKHWFMQNSYEPPPAHEYLSSISLRSHDGKLYGIIGFGTSPYFTPERMGHYSVFRFDADINRWAYLRQHPSRWRPDLPAWHVPEEDGKTAINPHATISYRGGLLIGVSGYKTEIHQYKPPIVGPPSGKAKGIENKCGISPWVISTLTDGTIDDLKIYETWDQGFDEVMIIDDDFNAQPPYVIRQPFTTALLAAALPPSITSAVVYEEWEYVFPTEEYTIELNEQWEYVPILKPVPITSVASMRIAVLPVHVAYTRIEVTENWEDNVDYTAGNVLTEDWT